MSVPIQRLIGGLGIVYVVVTIAPALFLPPPPPGGAAVDEVAGYYLGHRDALLISGWVGLLAFPLGFGFLAGLALLVAGEGKMSNWLVAISLLSISVTLATAAVQGILALAVPYVSTSARPDELKLLADVTQLGFSAAFVFETSYFIATGALGLLFRKLPRWLSFLSFIVAAVALLASLGVVVRSGALAAGGPVTLVALVAGLGWWLLAAVLLVVRPRQATALIGV